MSVILNIETSGKVCSVSLSKDGLSEFDLSNDNGMTHAVDLAPYVEKCMEELNRKEWLLDAVAVSIGPGSYTGLRIGLSLAKGLCLVKEVPLIGIPTLEILAVKAMFRSMDWEGDELLVPMIDARRMEVYTAVYNFALKEILPPQPMILDENSYNFIDEDKKLIFIGDGVSKAREVIKRKNAVWIDVNAPLAKDMIALSEKFLREGRFLDLNYSVPAYLKDFVATVPKNTVLKKPDNFFD